MKTGSKDSFCQKAILQVAMTGANVLTYGKLGLTLGLGERVAWNVHRLEYWFDLSVYAEMTTNGDFAMAALCTSNRPTGISLLEESVIDSVFFERVDWGVAATAIGLRDPIQRDYNAMPGGGLIVLPSPLYLAMDTVGLAGAHGCTLVIYYTTIQLAGEDYLQLVEMARIQT